MNRYRANPRFDKSFFRRTASPTRTFNVRPTLARGGLRM